MPQTSYTRLALPVSTPAANGEVGMDSSGRFTFYNGTLGRVAVLDDGIETNTFTMTGTVAVKTGVARWYLDASYTWVSGRIGVGTSPTGAAILVDVLKNGTTIYTTQANRPTVAISGNTQAIAGSDLTYTLRLRRT
jgi:hypothetical protein